MIALHPADYAGGATAPDGSGWMIGGDYYERNPRLTVPPGAREMVRFYQLCRGGMGGGGGLLPSQILRESVLNLDALDVIGAAFQEFRPPRRGAEA